MSDMRSTTHSASNGSGSWRCHRVLTYPRTDGGRSSTLTGSIFFHIPHPHPSDFARPPLMAYQSFTSTSQVPLNPRQLIQNEQLRYHPPSPATSRIMGSGRHWILTRQHTREDRRTDRCNIHIDSSGSWRLHQRRPEQEMTETDLGSSDDDMSGVGRKKLRRGAEQESVWSITCVVGSSRGTKWRARILVPLHCE